MSNQESVTERHNKLQSIIEAAQKRFGVYGVEKTSMREIAGDLRLSKASLYYYFPDKESLYVAVLEKEQGEFIERISENIRTIQDPESLLREYALVRLSHFRYLLNLSRLRLEAYSEMKPLFRKTIQVFREREKEIIMKIFDEGLIKGIFSIKEPDQTASLFLDLLKGIRLSVVTDQKTMIIDQEEYERLAKNTLMFTDIFVRGLKVNSSE
jgi:AcrR family transcriptional regulator